MKAYKQETYMSTHMQRSSLVVTSTRLSTSKATRKPAFYELRHTPFFLARQLGSVHAHPSQMERSMSKAKATKRYAQITVFPDRSCQEKGSPPVAYPVRKWRTFLRNKLRKHGQACPHSKGTAHPQLRGPQEHTGPAEPRRSVKQQTQGRSQPQA